MGLRSGGGVAGCVSGEVRRLRKVWVRSVWGVTAGCAEGAEGAEGAVGGGGGAEGAEAEVGPQEGDKEDEPFEPAGELML